MTTRMKARRLACEAAHQRHTEAAEKLRDKADEAGAHGEHDRFWALMNKACTHDALARNFG